MPRGLENDVFAALARTKGDINYPIDEKLDGHLLIHFPYKSWLQRYCNNVGNSLFHFLSVSLRLAGKYSLRTNSHKKQNVLKVYRLNYIYESNKSSPVSSLADEESQNLHVKMDKNHKVPGLNCTEKYY